MRKNWRGGGKSLLKNGTMDGYAARPLALWRFLIHLPEVESRTQGSRPRPRTQKKSKAKAKDSLSKDRTSRGQGQECSRPRTQAQAFSKKKVLQKLCSGDLQFIGVPRILDWGRPKPQIT